MRGKMVGALITATTLAGAGAVCAPAAAAGRASPPTAPPAAAAAGSHALQPAVSALSDRATAARATPAPQIHATTNVAPAPSWVPRLKQTETSSNWSGYRNDAISGNYFNYVYTRWVEPRFTCRSVLAQKGSQTSQWIGIDGKPNDPSLEQDGMIEGCTRSRTPYYGMFWETIPGPPHVYNGGRPGDQMAAAVTYVGNGDFRFQVVDLTNGDAIDVTEPCAAASCPLASDEAISEWPGKQLEQGITLTKFSTFPFYDFYATSYYAGTASTYYGWFGSTNLFATHRIHTIGPKQVKRNGHFPRGGRVVMSPGPLLQGGRAFYEAWRHAY